MPPRTQDPQHYSPLLWTILAINNIIAFCQSLAGNAHFRDSDANISDARRSQQLLTPQYSKMGRAVAKMFIDTALAFLAIAVSILGFVIEVHMAAPDWWEEWLWSGRRNEPSLHDRKSAPSTPQEQDFSARQRTLSPKAEIPSVRAKQHCSATTKTGRRCKNTGTHDGAARPVLCAVHKKQYGQIL
ncbi:uncharacterized protein A1O5_09730 [Cladophialophora psammophila CBS 110553]|uniref:Uncharacterized protein n=1 Tax=Cladophialophora psammophila CBS 110553 TaxID=1182543 RepID=W9X9G0_9EURO|nr:uncharacterized protein A1O5_09730 [Cladophialophora psammophila CBS 110553]EXJ67084.1 hypothetical protein A1O5_09730 [Cladophialophora psammophila CBS 110553]